MGSVAKPLDREPACGVGPTRVAWALQFGCRIVHVRCCDDDALDGLPSLGDRAGDGGAVSQHELHGAFVVDRVRHERARLTTVRAVIAHVHTQSERAVRCAEDAEGTGRGGGQPESLGLPASDAVDAHVVQRHGSSPLIHDAAVQPTRGRDHDVEVRDAGDEGRCGSGRHVGRAVAPHSPRLEAVLAPSEAVDVEATVLGDDPPVRIARQPLRGIDSHDAHREPAHR